MCYGGRPILFRPIQVARRAAPLVESKCERILLASKRENAACVSALVRAFRVAGGDAKTVSRGILDRLDPETAMAVGWLLRDIGPAEVAAQVTACLRRCSGERCDSAISHFKMAD